MNNSFTNNFNINLVDSNENKMNSNENKMNSNINNYIFNKNKFSLTKHSNNIYNKDLDYCKKYSIKNNKAGFNFFGNKNKCYLYKDHKPSNKIDNDLVNNYNIQKFYKNKKQKEVGINDINNNNIYFKELNHFNLLSSGLIKKTNVENLDNCMSSCLNNPDCKSITYFQEPYQCSFYNEIELNKNKNTKCDTYIINKNNLNNLKNINNEEEEEQDYKDKNNEKLKSHKTFHYDENKYTSCFTNEIHNNYDKLINNYNNICKKELGDEYIFSNNKNNINVVKCNDEKIKILCRPQYIENFSNSENNNEFNEYQINNSSIRIVRKICFYIIIVILTIIILYIILFLLKKI